jgi:hypothetical protein
VAQPKDETNASTLPDPELNPLLNPLLASHMGRWAEVYFTSPPEKREQAVADLLRELANDSPPEPVLPESFSPEPFLSEPVLEERNESAQERGADRTESVLPPDSFAATTEAALPCKSCGYGNSTTQRFCGMCGAPLSFSPTSSPQPIGETRPLNDITWEDRETPLPVMGRRGDEYDSQGKAESGVERYNRTEDRAWGDASPARLDTLFGSQLFSDQSEPIHRSYRMYVGVVLAILVALLVYMTWRSTAAFRSTVAAPSAPPIVAPATRESEPAKAEEPATTAPAPAIPKDNATPASAPAILSTRNRSQTRTKPKEDRRPEDRRAKARPNSRVVPVTVSSSTGSTEQTGFEELTTAEKYLNSGPGTARDSRQAATWLWKAVAKQNLPATMMLADLYLRGDGVTKSCDQARLLLDAAARKGGKPAAERLRNLQAFGCR